MELIKKAYILVKSVGIYGAVRDSELVQSFLKLTDSYLQKDGNAFFTAWGSFISSLSKSGTLNFSSALYELLLSDDNAFSRLCAAGGFDCELFNAAEREINAFSLLSEIEPDALISAFSDGELKSELVIWKNDNSVFDGAFEKLKEFYKVHGCGVFSRYDAFVWRDGNFVPVEHPDPISLSDLKGYEKERNTVVNNTVSFLSGKPANNVLLYGDRGTGKSSTVHSILNEYKKDGLRLIELQKSDISDFHTIISSLSNLPLHFIVFIDDLSFSEDNDSFAVLKAALEGGIAARPQNMLVYATSNRRHLLKESFASRDGDDMHINDTMQEQLSLSDRFGLTVTFTNPDRKKFYAILDAMADDRKIMMNRDVLHSMAENWALKKGGRSPRIAKQFMDVLGSLPEGSF